MGANRESAARQTEATRAALLTTILQLLESPRTEDLSFQEIARAARVSERTVFRYFPNHAALRDALIPHISARLGGVQPPESARAIGDYVERLYRACEANDGLVRTLVNTGMGRALLEGERTRRFEKLQAIVAKSAPRESAKTVKRAAATIRYVASGTAWEFYRYQAKLPIEDAIAAARQVIEAVLAEVPAPRKT